jgi:hypothetical protein|tara:strand:- start:715 stop:834 length:120 start_codon:yes stop_codon:yes gene_type:complete
MELKNEDYFGQGTSKLTNFEMAELLIFSFTYLRDFKNQE